ncbi:MAG: hypothetical protein AAGF95_33475 [Chloroflexota bacterium]
MKPRKYRIYALNTDGYRIEDSIVNTLSINQHGHVASWVRHNHTFFAFFHDGATMHLLDTSTNNGSVALDINDQGHIVGYTLHEIPRQIIRHAFYFDGTTMHDVHLPEWKTSEGRAINNRCQYVLQCRDSRGKTQSYRSIKEGLRHINPPGYDMIQGMAINQYGHMVGMFRTTKNTPSRAFFFDNSQIHNLGMFDGHDNRVDQTGISSAWGLNDHGHVVGRVSTRPQPSRAFVYDETGMRDLGTIPGYMSKALAINNASEIVGYAWTEDQNWLMDHAHALLWRNHALINLNDLVDDTDWHLRVAADINEVGQIVGWGDYQGQRQIFVLSPTSD